MSRHDWRDYLGKKEYERAFVDFFEDELVEAGYVWWDVVRRYLFEENQAAGGAVGGNLIGGCEFG